MSLFDHSIKDLHELIHKKEVKVSELVEHSFQKIQETDEKVQAFLTLNELAAKKKAEELDGKTSDHVLFGIPAGLKDNIVTKDLRTTAASKMLENFEPFYNATVVEKLNEANSITIGKLNMDEFAMGGTTENSAFQKTRNPWNLDYVPGGSSGGSAAAVASGQVKYSLGTDTGGSIRQPAAFCGIVGMKPTYGRVSRFGVVSFASSLDVVGPLTKTVEDNAYVLQAIAGLDPRDSMTSNREVPNFVEGLTGDIKGLKIAVPKEFLGAGVSEEIRESVKASLKVLEGLGATWEEVSLPHVEYSVPTYQIISSAEASANLARYDGIRYGYRTENAKDLVDVYKKSRSEAFGREVKLRILLGTFALSSGNYDVYFHKAQQVRTLIKQDFENIFENYDVIVGPTTPTPAYKIGELIEDPLTLYANDLLTVPMNLAGLPAISVPCGFSNGLPLGLQIIGKHFDEQTIYRVAHAFEQATDFHKQKPQLEGGVS